MYKYCCVIVYFGSLIMGELDDLYYLNGILKINLNLPQ